MRKLSLILLSTVLLVSCNKPDSKVETTEVATIVESETEVESESEVESETELESQTETQTIDTIAELSDDLYSFQIQVDGDILQFPITYTDLEAHGWVNIDDDKTATLVPNQYGQSLWEKDGSGFIGTIANFSPNTETIEDCIIVGMKFPAYSKENKEIEIIMPGNIQLYKSSLEDVESAYGTATSEYESEFYTKHTYEYDRYQNVVFMVDAETKVVDEIEIENLTPIEGLEYDVEISTEVPEIVTQYQTPASIGDNIYDFNVELAGDLYTLPAPVSVFLENGFTIIEDSTESSVISGDAGWVELSKDNQRFRALAENYTDSVTLIENCFVLSINSSIHGPEFPIKLPHEIQLGMTEAELDKALEGYQFEKEVDGEQTYYRIYESSQMNSTYIAVYEGTISTIEIDNSPKKSELFQ